MNKIIFLLPFIVIISILSLTLAKFSIVSFILFVVLTTASLFIFYTLLNKKISNDLSDEYSKKISNLKTEHNKEINELNTKSSSKENKELYKNLVNNAEQLALELVNIKKEFEVIQNKFNDLQNTKNLSSNDVNKEQVDQYLQETSDNFDDYKSKTDEMIEFGYQISESIDSIASALDEILAIIEQSSIAIENITQNAESLLLSTEETSAAMIELSSNAKQSVENAQETSSVAQKMKNDAQDGNKSVQETVQSITSLNEIVLKAASVIENLGKNMGKIGAITNVIKEIADQTNLLALNAAIEAARAGDAGRGFAVVADEVRKLAERSSQSTKEISNLIKNLMNEAEDAVLVVKGGTKSAEEATKLAKSAGSKINQVLEGVEYTTMLIDKIASSSIDQSTVAEIVAESSNQMNNQVSEVSFAIKEQSIGVKHIVDAVSHLKPMMEQIKNSVSTQSEVNVTLNEKANFIKNNIKLIQDVNNSENDTEEVVSIENNEDLILNLDKISENCINKVYEIQKELDRIKSL